MTTWQDNAAEFAALDQGEGWPFARLVACSVERKDSAHRPVAIVTGEKVSARQFAEAAGTSANRVLRYLKAWEDAAKRGWVDDPEDLTPDDVHRITDPDQPWYQKDGGTYDTRNTGGRPRASVGEIAERVRKDHADQKSFGSEQVSDPPPPTRDPAPIPDPTNLPQRESTFMEAAEDLQDSVALAEKAVRSLSGKGRPDHPDMRDLLTKYASRLRNAADVLDTLVSSGGITDQALEQFLGQN